MFCYLDFHCYFEANGRNHIHFRLIQVLKNSTAWHFSLSHHLLASWNLYIPRTLRSRRANAHLLIKFNAWTCQRLLNWNPTLKLTIVLIWKTPSCLKFGKTPCCRKFATKKLWVWAANDACFPWVLIWVVLGAMILVKSTAMHSG